MKLSEMQNTNSENKSSSTKKKNINETYEEIKNCSSDELMGRLAKEIQTQKSNGVFDYEALKDSIDKIKIYLPNQTYENMLRIIDGLK